MARTKVLQKNGINMDAVKWIALEQPQTKEQYLATAPADIEKVA